MMKKLLTTTALTVALITSLPTPAEASSVLSAAKTSLSSAFTKAKDFLASGVDKAKSIYNRVKPYVSPAFSAATSVVSAASKVVIDNRAVLEKIAQEGLAGGEAVASIVEKMMAIIPGGEAISGLEKILTGIVTTIKKLIDADLSLQGN